MGVAAVLYRAGHVFRSRQHKAEEGGMMDSNVSSKVPTVEASALVREGKKSRKRRQRRCNPCNPQKIVRFLFEDWLFLAVLGVLMAFLSLAVDACIDQLQTFHMYLMSKVERADDDLLNFALTYIVWMVYTMVVMLTSVIFVHYVGPQAIGSGIPEMKTILRGVRLKECLSFRTLLAKMVGLALAIGSGFPIGKEGPFVHVGSIVANLISRLVRNFKSAYANESRSCEMLAAGCAAGVACTFSAPIGGVLFSIEVTAVYFAVRDYWRGFFAAACGSAIFSLLRLYTHSSEVTVVAFYQTTFKNRAFYPEELFIFALMGLFCGITGAIFIWIHRQLVLFLRRNSFMKIIFQRNWIVYPIVICAFYATLTHPIGFGRYITGEVVFSRTLKDFFMNCTWSADPSRFEACAGSVAVRWSADESIFAELTVFVIGFYFLSIVASTLPVPAGIFMPVFVIGAGMGRLFGEIVAHQFPDGLRGDRQMLVYPGIYAVVGASSFCGAVTHTVSVAVIAFELTGQLLHILPVMIAVIIANITCSSFQPSFFDSIIKIKHLPYLPDIPKSTSEVHTIRAEQIMVTNVRFLSKKSTYRELQDLLICMPRLRAFPVVDDPETRILLGSVSRATLLQLLDAQVGEATRRAEAAKRAKVEREQQAIAQVSRKKALFSIGTTEASRKAAVENFFATYAKPSPVDRFRILPVLFHERHGEVVANGEREAKAYSPRTRRPLRRSISETNTRKMGTMSRVQKGSAFETVSSASDMQSDSVHLNHHKKLSTVHSAHDLYTTLGGMLRSFTHTFHRHSKKRRTNSDLMAKERREWERKQLACIVDFGSAAIDPAPFQLVEDTSLYKVHSIFSLLGIRRAYVTKCGVLVGVVALRDLRSAIERAQWGELNSRTERSDENMEQIIAASERRSSGHSDLHQTDLDSDTDDEDCILPRVEVEEATPSTCELEQRLPMARTSSDVSDQYIIDESETSIAPSQSTSIIGGSDDLKDPLHSKLESYLEAFGEKSAGQKRRASILNFFLSHKTPGPETIKSTRRVLIVEPKEGPVQMGGASEKIDGDFEDTDHINGDTVAPTAQDSCSPMHHKYDDLSEIASKGHTPQMTISGRIISNQQSTMTQHENTRQERIAEKCSVWIDDDDESFIALSGPVQASDGEPASAASDEEPVSAASTSYPVQRRESSSFFINHENGQLADARSSMFTYHRAQRSISDVIPPRAFHNMPMEQEMRTAMLDTAYGTPSSSGADNFTCTGHLPTDDDL